ncbi:MAG: hypothetical protein ACWGPS_08690 [Candidatus Promineifilaceae bacterium]
MRRIISIMVIAVAVVGIMFGAYFLWDQLTRVSTAALEEIVQRDGVPSEAGSIPDEILDRLASYRVVLLGETHFLPEHTRLTAELLRELHARGFRQFLFEWTQAADWALADFVNDGGLLPDWTVPNLLGDPIVAIRDFNRVLPENERIQVHAIDIHLEDYGGTKSWLTYLDFLAQKVLPDPGPLTAFLQADHDTYETHTAQLETLRVELEDGRSEFASSWGNYWYDTVFEMIEVELKGVAARAIKETDYEEYVRLREEAIKWLADRRIQATTHGTLINFGSTHSQKEGLWGTDGIEWLGDYLVHKSPATEGSVIAIWVPAAYIVSAPGSDIPDGDLEASPENELLRVMNQAWPNQIVFLPLDDSLFGHGRVPINASGEILVGTPKRHYDMVALLPLAHRDEVDD